MSSFRADLFRGRHALVTGGGSGINLRIAERLAGQGAAVTVVGRTQSRLDSAVSAIQATGGRAAGFAADVRDYAALERAVALGVAEFGGIDILVCGAAGNFPAPASDMSANAFRSVVDIDLLGTFNACRASFQHLRCPGASVVNISAPQAVQAMPFQAHVCAAKAGVDMLTRALAVEWGGVGVRVNAVIPGAVAGTEGMDRLAPAGPVREALERQLPLGRLASTDDIADSVVFLCSDAASYVTGAILACDGGMTAGGITIRAPAGFPVGRSGG